MIEKEVSELRRQFRSDRSGISKVYGCYVNENRTIVSTFEQSLGLTSQEEAEAYFGLLKKSLSGTLGKNLLDIPFTNEQVMHGEAHALLMKLRDSRLEDDDTRNIFYQKIISCVSLGENYLILIAHNAYDVPYRGKDDLALSDGSEDMFSHIICSICPVKKSKPGLGYDYQQQSFCTIAGNWLVSPPQLGFLFPAFDDRTTNLYNCLCYTRSDDDAHESFISTIFQAEAPKPAMEQRRNFESVLSGSLENECSMQVIQAVHEQLSDMIQMHKESKVPEPLMIDRQTIEEVLEDCGVSEQRLDAFQEQFDVAFGAGQTVSPKNIIDNRRFDIKTTGVTIHVKPEARDLVQTKTIDGIKYIMIRAEDNVEVSGVTIQFEPERTAEQTEHTSL